MNSTYLNSSTATTRIPAMAKAFLSLLENLQVGQLDLITPEKTTLSFKGKSEGTHATLIVNSWDGVSSILRSGDIGVAEAYRDQKIDTPDLLSLLVMALENQDVLDKALHGSFWGTLLYRLKHLMNRNTRSGSKKNIHAH